MADQYVGQIILFGGNFEIQDWHICDGTLLSVQQYTALFSLLGTTYGGDGKTTFGIPDLRGAVPIGVGNSSVSGRKPITWGQKGGAYTTTTTLTAAQLPTHTHTWTAAAPTMNLTTTAKTATYTIPATAKDPSTNVPANNTYLSKGDCGGTEANIYASGVASSDVLQMPGGSITIPSTNVTGTITISGTNANAGAGASINIDTVSPYVGLNYLICINGLYPPRP
jgi:microcystin-dependent protein